MDVRAENTEKSQATPALRLIKEPDVAAQLSTLVTEIGSLQAEIKTLKQALSFFLSAAPGEKGYQGANELYPISAWAVRSMEQLSKSVASQSNRNPVDAQRLDEILAHLKALKRDLRPNEKGEMNFDDIFYQLEELKAEVASKRSGSQGVFFAILIFLSVFTLFSIVYIGSHLILAG